MTEVCPRLISFYLPQFHPIAENDDWWGTGFTEWRNVTRGRPLFAGHDQPRRPADLGYYDLRVPEVQQQQADLARAYGIHGFCYYHYWFAGRRLLERPLQAVLDSGSPDLPFCVCWANENWTRRWDGKEAEVLIGQTHSPETDLAFIRDLLPTLGDDRYITRDGRRVLMVYRPTLLHHCRRATDTWRDEVLKAGLGELHLVMVQHGDHDPVAMGFDAAVEFPPHGFQAPDIRGRLENLDPDFEGGIYDYAAMAEFARSRPRPPFPLHRGVMLGWDNTARRGHAATVYHDATPEAYRQWLEHMLQDTMAHDEADGLVFINAWNEWAEGTYLEPDERHGHAYLEATRQALRAVGGLRDGGGSNRTDRPVAQISDPSPADIRRISRRRRRARGRHRLQTLRVRAGNFMRRPGKVGKITSRLRSLTSRVTGGGSGVSASGRVSAEPVWTRATSVRQGSGQPVLFVGHDAHLAGSQMLLLEMLRLVRESGSIRPMVMLADDGILTEEYRKLASTCQLSPMLAAGLSLETAVERAIAAAPHRPVVAICNTVATATATGVCRDRDLPVVQLINELPTTIRANGWEDRVFGISGSARQMIFVSEFSKQAFVREFDLPTSRCAVVHPGWLGETIDPKDRPAVRRRIRRELGIPESAMVALGCGQIHPRKGVDLFLQTAARALGRAGTENLHFVWIGDGTDEHTRWIRHDLELLDHADRIHLIPSRADVNPWFEGADVFVLSSREDPYPIVGIQAMASGLPVLAFDRCGGAPEAIAEGGGRSIAFPDTEAMGDAVAELIGDKDARHAMGDLARRYAARHRSRDHLDGVLAVVARTCGVDLSP